MPASAASGMEQWRPCGRLAGGLGDQSGGLGYPGGLGGLSGLAGGPGGLGDLLAA